MYVCMYIYIYIYMFQAECSAGLTPLARQGWSQLLSYVGGAIIYCKKHYKAVASIVVAQGLE